MNQQIRPPVWQMIREAVAALGTPTTNVAVRDWVLKHYPGTNKTTLSCQIAVCTVNHDSRLHYAQNQRPRRCDAPQDLLYRPERGRLELYEPSRRGVWEIAERDDGTLCVRRAENREGGATPASPGVAVGVASPGGDLPTSEAVGSTFAAESHLRDYLVQHLEDLESGLDLYTDEHGIDGIEFSTPIGRIDILATDREGRFVVIELKVGQGPAAVCGQLMRYMGWIKRHLAEGKPVRGIISPSVSSTGSATPWPTSPTSSSRSTSCTSTSATPTRSTDNNRPPGSPLCFGVPRFARPTAIRPGFEPAFGEKPA